MNLLYLLFLGCVTAMSITIDGTMVWKGKFINGYSLKQDADDNIIITSKRKLKSTSYRYIDRKKGLSMWFFHMDPGYKPSSYQKEIMGSRECYPATDAMKRIVHDSNFLINIHDGSVALIQNHKNYMFDEKSYDIEPFIENAFGITTHTSKFDVSDEQMGYIPGIGIIRLSTSTSELLCESPISETCKKVNKWIKEKGILNINTLIQESKCTGLKGPIIATFHGSKFIFVDINGAICEIKIYEGDLRIF